MNSALAELIQRSHVLRSKLNPKQLQRFLDRALSLPEESQELLKQKLKAEEGILYESRKQAVLRHAERVQELLKTEKIRIFREAETYQDNQDHEEEAFLLRQIDDA